MTRRTRLWPGGGWREIRPLGQQRLYSDASLHPRQRRAEAVVRPRREGEMIVGRSTQPQDVRLIEVLGIVIRGAKAEPDILAGGNPRARDFRVLPRHAPRQLLWRVESQHFFDERWHEREIGLKSSSDRRVFQQQQHGRRNQHARSCRSGDPEQFQDARDLVGRERFGGTAATEPVAEPVAITLRPPGHVGAGPFVEQAGDDVEPVTDAETPAGAMRRVRRRRGP